MISNKLMYQVSLSFLTMVFGLLTLLSCSKESGPIFPDVKDGRNYSLSTDTLYLDTLPSLYLSSTYSLRIYNPHPSKNIVLKSIRIQGGIKRGFQLNIDGFATQIYEHIQIEARDSIQLFIRAFLPEGTKDQPELVADSLRIEEMSGRIHYLPIIAIRQNVDHVDVLHIREDMERARERPLLVKDSIVVEEGATWRLISPSQLWLGSSAYIRVKGRLQVQGQLGSPIRLVGIRRDSFLPRISYSRVPNQWGGIVVSSTGILELKGLHLLNSRWGIYYEERLEETSSPALLMSHCRLHNIGGIGIRATQGIYSIKDSELSNTLGATLLLSAGRYEVERSSIINHYPWPGVRSGSALVYNNGINGQGETSSSLYIRHCIIDGSMDVKERRLADSTIYLGGEVQIYLEKPILDNQVLLMESYIRSIDYNHRQGVQTTQVGYLSTKDIPDSLYRRVGKDEEQRRDYLFDFRPRPTAIFVGVSGHANGAEDLDGKPRYTPMTYGAYEVMR